MEVILWLFEPQAFSSMFVCTGHDFKLTVAPFFLVMLAAGARDVVASALLPPHIYLVAANAFRKMLREKCNQSLIVNGTCTCGRLTLLPASIDCYVFV